VMKCLNPLTYDDEKFTIFNEFWKENFSSPFETMQDTKAKWKKTKTIPFHKISDFPKQKNKLMRNRSGILIHCQWPHFPFMIASNFPPHEMLLNIFAWKILQLQQHPWTRFWKLMNFFLAFAIKSFPPIAPATHSYSSYASSVSRSFSHLNFKMQEN
jgi:hypothetical protein